MNEVSKLACVGLDCHRNFSLASARDESGRIAWRKRLGHVDRHAVKKELSTWPEGVPVILEGTFGWGWMSDELRAAKLDPHLSSGRKVAAWRASGSSGTVEQQEGCGSVVGVVVRAAAVPM